MQLISISDKGQRLAELKKHYKVVDVIDLDTYVPNSDELYNRIKSNFQIEYQSDERLVFTATQDYHKTNHPNIALQSLQAMINEIDISNFFVAILSTNPDLEKEYSWVHRNISTDPIPVHLYRISGSYSNTYSDIIPWQKYRGLKQDSVLLDEMPDREKNLLVESKTFCILPWISLYVETDNRVLPCCYYKDEVLGDAKTDTLKTIWNNDKTRQLRLDMLKEKELASCRGCYLKDQQNKDDTVRASYNRKYLKEYNRIRETKPDGRLDRFELPLINFNASNLCNLQCRMCVSTVSSSLHAVEKQLGIPVNVKALVKPNPTFFEQYCEHIEHIQQVIFAGGEPLMMKETYDFVKRLGEHNRHDVELHYITNMTHTGLGSTNVFDIWRKFNHINLYASLDAENDRALYLRPGPYTWNKIVDFKKQIRQKRPDIFFCVQSTITILNALHMPDFHRSWVEQGLIDADQWVVNTLTNRQYLRVTTAPAYLKDQIRDKFQRHLEWLRPRDPYGKSTIGYMAIINAMDSAETFDPDLFWKHIEQRDKIYNVNLLDVFPELVDLPR